MELKVYPVAQIGKHPQGFGRAKQTRSFSGKELEKPNGGPCLTGWSDDPPMKPSVLKKPENFVKSLVIGQVVLRVVRYNIDTDEPHAELSGATDFGGNVNNVTGSSVTRTEVESKNVDGEKKGGESTVDKRVVGQINSFLLHVFDDRMALHIGQATRAIEVLDDPNRQEGSSKVKDGKPVEIPRGPDR